MITAIAAHPGHLSHTATAFPLFLILILIALTLGALVLGDRKR